MTGKRGMKPAPRSATLFERLMWHSVAAPSGCRIWIGAAGARGNSNREYGRITVAGKVAYAHRVSYELQVGPIPDGMQIDHLCRRPRCINPQHLQAVTPQVNTLRGTSPGARAKRRTQCIRGHAYEGHSRVFGGRRYCMTCQREWKRANAERVREYARNAYYASKPVDQAEAS